MSEEEILSEYLKFLRNLPDLIETEKKKLIDIVSGNSHNLSLAFA